MSYIVFTMSYQVYMVGEDSGL